jgi:hypothetical protein
MHYGKLLTLLTQQLEQLLTLLSLLLLLLLRSSFRPDQFPFRLPPETKKKQN